MVLTERGLWEWKVLISLNRLNLHALSVIFCFTLPCIKLIFSGIILCYVMYVASSSITFASLLATSSNTEKYVKSHAHVMLMYLLINKKTWTWTCDSAHRYLIHSVIITLILDSCWCHEIETVSVLLSVSVGNPPQRVTIAIVWSFFVVSLKNQVSRMSYWTNNGWELSVLLLMLGCL